MRNKITLPKSNSTAIEQHLKTISRNRNCASKKTDTIPEILLITTFPPRECGIATYSQDLVKALKKKFKKSFGIKIGALENGNHFYGDDVEYVLETENSASYLKLAEKINADKKIQLVFIQHEFGLFRGKETVLVQFMEMLNKPILITFHTILPNPNKELQENVQKICQVANAIIVMTKTSEIILENDYQIAKEKINIIPHGTHLVEHLDKDILKEKYNLSGRKVLSTFGLLSSGKSIETTLNALPAIIKENPDVLFLIIGITHPSVVKSEGELYRNFLKDKIDTLQLHKNVLFINQYLPLNDLLDYLQLTDVYLFTSKDPNQAVSGTFSYAMSCGCPIISTPIPHALEVLKNGTGVIIDFENDQQLSKEVNTLLSNQELCNAIVLNGLHQMAPNAWENSAIAHSKLFESISENSINLYYKIPKINLKQVKRLTTTFGMIQFSVINKPNLQSGYTLDDNARALIAICQHFKLTKEASNLIYLTRYFNFIKHCLLPSGNFMNYVNEKQEFTSQNDCVNLEDANGRAIWALGYLISASDYLPPALTSEAEKIMTIALKNVSKIHSSRAMAFIIKGIYYSQKQMNSNDNIALSNELSDRLVQMYKHESDEKWEWFESYLTYGNSILPEALLCAYFTSGNLVYKKIAQTSFDFLLSKIFTENDIKVISNQGWLHNGETVLISKNGGEQPIDVAYTILALHKFYAVFNEEEYLQKMEIAFSWFLGNNHLNKIIYNPCTGGCYDGLEEDYINLNQGAESTLSYLMARLVIENHFGKNKKIKLLSNYKFRLENKKQLL
jgi:glycosyltransferase involved in cell wall biosynthesis